MGWSPSPGAGGPPSLWGWRLSCPLRPLAGPGSRQRACASGRAPPGAPQGRGVCRPAGGARVALSTPDPVVASLAQDIFKELSQIEACQGPMQMRLIPTLVSIMQAPADKLPAGLCAVSGAHGWGWAGGGALRPAGGRGHGRGAGPLHGPLCPGEHGSGSRGAVVPERVTLPCASQAVSHSRRLGPRSLPAAPLPSRLCLPGCRHS